MYRVCSNTKSSMGRVDPARLMKPAMFGAGLADPGKEHPAEAVAQHEDPLGSIFFSDARASTAATASSMVSSLTVMVLTDKAIMIGCCLVRFS